MVQAVFIDFYGTVVYEDGAVIKELTHEISETGSKENPAVIGAYWWKEFQSAFMGSFGESFRLQRELELESLKETINHFHSSADPEKLSGQMFAYWMEPPIFEESKSFFAICPVPVYVVSNIDRADVVAAIEFHGLKPNGIFTSEDARAYKPRKELFELALRETGLRADQVVHIGDSLSSDVQGAYQVGISAIWVNRGGREVPVGVTAVDNLMDVFQTQFFKYNNLK